MKWLWPRKWEFVLPSVYILAKRKAEFLKARSIICYHQFFFSKAQRALGKVIAELMQELIGDSCFNCRSLDEVVCRLLKFNDFIDEFWEENKALDVAVQIYTLADDLAGFFPSPPQSVMVRAVDWILERTLEKKNRPLHEIKVSVAMKATKPGFWGYRSTEYHHKAFHMEFFKPLLLHVLESAVCDVRGSCKRQIRGGPIGAPVSPPWLILVVSLREHLWLQALKSNRVDRLHKWEVIRYVDNRYMVALRVAGHTEVPIELFDTKFYGQTVVLEPESRDVLVGTELLIPSQQFSTLLDRPRIQCRYVVQGYPESYSPGDSISTNHQWRYRSPLSGASQSNLMAAFTARLHLARRASFPPEKCQQSIARLCTVYLMLQYPCRWITQALQRFLKKHKCVDELWKQVICKAISNGDITTVHRLGRDQ